MKTVQKLLIGTVMSAASIGNTFSAELNTSANVSLSSDYVFRGISQTNENPSVQGGYDITVDSGWYAGIWASNIGFGEGSIEADIYAGWRQQVNNEWAIGVGIIRYLYPGATGSEFNYNEIYTNITFKRLTINVTYSDDYFGSDVNHFYYIAGDYDHPVTENLFINFHAGLNQFESNYELTRFLGAAPPSKDNYWDWSIGLSYQLTDRMSLDIIYVDNDIASQSCAKICDSRITAELSATF